MVPVTAAVVAHRAADVFRHRGEIADERFERLGFQRGVAGDGFVQVIDIGFVMTTMMDFHRQRIEMRFKRGFVVGQGW